MMATTLPTWPATLPQPDRDGYAYDLQMGLVRTAMQGGTVRQRRTVWGMPSTISLSWRMNTKQLGTLQTFLDAHAYGWFAMDLVTGAARVWNAASDCMLHKVRFISDPSHNLIAPNLWRVTIAAEVESMIDPRADAAGVVAFETVDAVTPQTIDELSNFDTLTL